MTNYERIKQMTVEEMAEFITTITSCDDGICVYCQYYTNTCPRRHTEDWLTQEVKK